MTLPRRQLLKVAATSPLLVLAPPLERVVAASTVGAVRGEALVDGESLSGLSLSWLPTAHDSDGREAVATVRALVDGRWTDPIEVCSDVGHGPHDPAGREHGPAVLVPGAEAFEIVPLPTAAISDLRHHPIQRTQLSLDLMVDEGSVTPPGASPLTTVEPIVGLRIIERSNWTNRGRLDTIDCVIGSSVFGLGCRSDVGLRHAIVHHTVNINDYGADDVPELLRGIQRFHVDTRGWDDIAYNFVIDRFGRVWHAREGDITEPIPGGHTTGLNAESLGVAILGTYIDVDPGQEVVDSLSLLLGWKLSLHGVDPLGSTSVRSAGGDFAEPGDLVMLRNISGHRDNQHTVCPGSVLYERLPEVRQAASDMVPIFGTLRPAYGLDAIGLAGWAIDRFAPTAKVDIDVFLDGSPHITLSATDAASELEGIYPDAGVAHGFRHTVPIDLDTTSIVVNARAGEGRTTELMDLTLFATFIDVEPDRFFASGVYFLRENELTRGTVPGLFEPMDELTRAQMATFLHRFMDLPQPAGQAPFLDVDRDGYYSDAVDWLYGAGITTGTSATTFSPGDFVTRAQMAAFLWRLCGSIPPSAPSPFLDIPPGTYFTVAVEWLFETGITQGREATRFDPAGLVTRGEMATFLHRLSTTPEAWTRVPPPSPVEL